MAFSALLVVPIAKADGAIAIDDCEELQLIGNDGNYPLDGDYILGGDIDCSDTPNWDESDGFEPIGPNYDHKFTGTFDGDGHTISDLYIRRSSTEYVGLFGWTDGATIKNVNLKDEDILGRNAVGGLVGFAVSTTIQRISVVNTGDSTKIAAIGYEDEGTPVATVGGLVGVLAGDSSIADAFARTTVASYYEGFAYYGGGIVGYTSGANGTITNAYAVPILDGAFVTNSAGPFVGNLYYDTTLTSTFWDNTVYSSSDGTTTSGNDYAGRTTSWLKTQSNLVSEGWDFNSVWVIDGANDGYPHLRAPADVALADANNDKNGDSIIDSTQPYIGSAYNASLQQLVLLEAEATCTVSSIQSVTPADLSTGDAGYTYPAGLVDFTLEGCGAPGYTTTVIQYYFGVPSTGVVLRKYNENTGKYATITDAVISSVIINGQNVTKVTYSVTDGGELDADGEVNGTIVDPAGLAKTVPGVPNTGEKPVGILGIVALTAGLGVLAAGAMLIRRRA